MFKRNGFRPVTINMKKIVYVLILLIFLSNKTHALDLDMTVDDEIRKNYNPSKLIQDTGGEEETLPDLPVILDMEDDNIQPAEIKTQTAPPKQIVSTGNIKIRRGTSFNVVNSSKISDWQRKGTTVKFTAKTPIVKKKYTIPASTVFIGEVIESHQPQITCNGGLVVIRVKSMLYKGQTIPINAYVTRADAKKIFLNNIKGDRTYLKTMWKKGNWGRTLFGRMFNLTVNLGGDGATLLLSPFPLAYGTICLGVNTLVSPITAFFSKGGHVSIPAGSEFRIKLLDDAFID